MTRRLFPKQADNAYRGHKVALWLFGFIVFVKTAIGAGTIFNGRGAAVNADGIPLDTFGSAGAQAFISIFAASVREGNTSRQRGKRPSSKRA